jgi:hypothetical protein
VQCALNPSAKPKRTKRNGARRKCVDKCP